MTFSDKPWPFDYSGAHPEEVTLDELLLHFSEPDGGFVASPGVASVSSFQETSPGCKTQQLSPCDQVNQEQLLQQALRKREKNRSAARQSRLKKKEQEKKLKEKLHHTESLASDLRQVADKFRSLYLHSLQRFATRAAFFAYLRENPMLVRDPQVKPVLQGFVTDGIRE